VTSATPEVANDTSSLADNGKKKKGYVSGHIREMLKAGTTKKEVNKFLDEVGYGKPQFGYMLRCLKKEGKLMKNNISVIGINKKELQVINYFSELIKKKQKEFNETNNDDFLNSIIGKPLMSEELEEDEMEFNQEDMFNNFEPEDDLKESIMQMIKKLTDKNDTEDEENIFSNVYKSVNDTLKQTASINKLTRFREMYILTTQLKYMQTIYDKKETINIIEKNLNKNLISNSFIELNIIEPVLHNEEEIIDKDSMRILENLRIILYFSTKDYQFHFDVETIDTEMKDFKEENSIVFKIETDLISSMEDCENIVNDIIERCVDKLKTIIERFKEKEDYE
jgi:hypothetical protein